MANDTAAPEPSGPVFRLTLHPTYYNQGFFNVPVDYDHLVGGEGTATLSLRGGGILRARVDRHSNPNGTARIMGGASLRDWFQKRYSVGDTVRVRFASGSRMTLG